MKKIISLFLFASMLSCSQAQTQSEKQTEQASETKTQEQTNEKWLTLKEEAYQIDYPSNWDLDQSKQMGSAFFLFSPIEGPDDLFKENINLMTENVSGMELTLEQYVNISEMQVKRFFNDAEILSSETIKTDAGEYHLLAYTATQGQLKLRFKQQYYLTKELAYVLTLTLEQDNFEKYMEEGTKILKTFTLK